MIVIALLFLVAASAWGAVDSSARLAAPFDSVRRYLTRPNGFHAQDFDLLLNFGHHEVHPLPAVERLLREPAFVDTCVPRLRHDLADTDATGRLSADSLWPWLGVAVPPPAPASLAARLHGVSAHLGAYLQPLSARDRSFLVREGPPLFLHHEDDTSLNAIQAESLSLREDAMVRQVMRLAGKLPAAQLAVAAADLESAGAAILAETRAQGWRKTAADLRALRRQGIPVDIGGEGDDVHHVSRGIIFDPGGNDRYEFPKTPQPGGWSLIIDLAGDDEYHAVDTAGGAAGFLSVQVVVDLGGDDRYLGQDFAFGSAVMGYSHWFDAGGNDLYQARCASLGFAFEGIGVLENRAGNDVYSSYYLSQGAAMTGGLGVLLDREGNDQYLSRPAFVDDLRYQDHFLSLSQGFATGFAPDYPGGIGVLWDRSGEDLYAADIFAQGSGYWFSLGLLMDDAGNDQYLAHQYAQGAGVHFAVGVLWDRAGDDTRVSKGVSQGCGHDGGFGLLVDERGNDRTFGVDMSLGGGSADGLGIYCDFGGEDQYGAENTAMTLGHGDMRRDRGSMGFFLDLGGNDRYPPGFGNDTAWHTYDGIHQGYGYGRDAGP